MRLRATKGAEIIDSVGQRHDVLELRLNGQTIWPVYALELSVQSLSFTAAGGDSTIAVYGLSLNEDGTEIRRVALTPSDVTISKIGNAAFTNVGFKINAPDRGTSAGDGRSCTYYFTWKGVTASLPCIQEANVATLTGVSRYFVVGGNTYAVGEKVTFSSSAQSVSLSCYFVNHYVYTSGHERDEQLNGAIYAVQGTGFSFANNVLTIAENTGASARTATITGRFPGPTAEYTMTAEQEKPAIVVYDVRWTAYNMRQVGGKKAFTFAITYNSNLTGAVLDFVAYKMNNGVRTDIAFLRGVTATGTSYTYSGADFANNDSTASGDKYYIEFSYGGQTFTTPELTNQVYLQNAKVVYNTGHTYILANASNFAYVTVDVMQGGTVLQQGVRADVTGLTATGLNIANGRIYGSNRGTTEGAAIQGTITSVVYGSVTLATSLSVRQEANVRTTGSAIGVLTLNGQAYSSDSQISVTYASHSYDAFASAYREDSYTSGATQRVNLTATLQASGTGFSLSGNTLSISENGGTARTGTLKLLSGSSTLVTLYINQAAYVPSYWLTMTATYRQVGGRKIFTIVAQYSNGLRGERVSFQPFRMNGGTRYDIGAATTVTMPGDLNETIVSITSQSQTVSGDVYFVEASYGGRVLATVEATL